MALGPFIEGNPLHYPLVASGLFRLLSDIDTEHFDLSTAELALKDDARRFAGNATEKDIFPLLQHYGFPTNLVDFTTDLSIAFYFACDCHEAENSPQVRKSERSAAQPIKP